MYSFLTGSEVEAFRYFQNVTIIPMTTVPKRSFATAPFLVGALMLLCALTFYYFAVLKIDYRKTVLMDLRPSDAAEYFAQAKALVKDGWPSIQIGYDKLPCTTPVGYPALMLPWLKILPEADSVLVPFRTNQTLGLLLLLAVFGFYAYLAMPLTGGFAVLLLATLPVFFTFCRSSMSEISASALIVLAFIFTYLGLKEERRWKIYLSAVFLGLSLNIRLQSLFFAPLLLAAALFPAKETPLRWFLHCAALLIVFALAASPVVVLNTIQFHSPLKTGYGFWLPALLQNHELFSLHYKQHRHVMEGICTAPATVYGRQFFWHRHILRRCVCFIDMRRRILHPGEPVRYLRFFRRLEFPCGDRKLPVPRWTLLPAAPNPLGCGCRFTCDMGDKKSFFRKTDHCRRGHLRFVCRGLSGLPFALRLQHSANRSIPSLGRSPFH